MTRRPLFSIPYTEHGKMAKLEFTACGLFAGAALFFALCLLVVVGV